MIERHVSLAVLPDRGAEFERFFTEEYGAAARRMPGLLECSLLRESERPDRYQIVFRWESAEAAAAWRTSPTHQALQPALNALHSGMEITAYTQVA